MITVYAPGLTVEVRDNVVTAPADSVAVGTGSLQTMDGWEATAIGWQVSKATNLYDPTWAVHAPAVMAKLANEMGIDRLQLPVRSGWHNTVDYWPQFQAGTIGRATLEQNWYKSLSNGTPQFGEFDFTVQHMLQPWLAAMGSRPRVVSLIFTDFGTTGKTLDFSTQPTAYAAFVKVYVDRLVALGVPVDCIDVTLEPENTNGWQNATRIGNALVALKAILPNVRLIAPSCTNAYNTVPFCQAIEQVPGALAALDTVGYHRYGSGDYAGILTWALDRGKKTGMTEWFNATIDTVLDDLTIANVSTWQKWSIAGRVGSGSNPQSGYYLFDGTTVNYAPNSPALSMIFPYVRLGAVRKTATGSAKFDRIAAFENADGRQTVLLRATGLTTARISGLKPGTYGVLRCGSTTQTPSANADVVVGAAGYADVPITNPYMTVYGK